MCIYYEEYRATKYKLKYTGNDMTKINFHIFTFCCDKVRDKKINYKFPNFNGATAEIWDLISKTTPHFTGHMITYTC